MNFFFFQKVFLFSPHSILFDISNADHILSLILLIENFGHDISHHLFFEMYIPVASELFYTRVFKYSNVIFFLRQRTDILVPVIIYTASLFQNIDSITSSIITITFNHY